MTETMAEQYKDYPTYTLPSGTVVYLKGVSPFLLQAIMSNSNGKPQPPFIEVEIARKKKSQPNYNDPDYKAALELWESEKSVKIVRLLTTKAILGSVEDYVSDESKMAEYQEMASLVWDIDYSDDDLKYTWLADELANPDDFEAFQEAVQQLTMPTEDAVAESSKSSDSDSE